MNAKYVWNTCINKEELMFIIFEQYLYPCYCTVNHSCDGGHYPTTEIEEITGEFGSAK